MPQYPQRFWLAALVVAWSYDFLFWAKPVGISFLFLSILLLLAGFILAYMEKKQPARLSYVLSGLVVITALVTTLRGEPFTRFLNSLLALLALGLLVLTFYNGAWVRYRLLDYIAGSFELLIAAVSRAIGLRLAPKPEEGGAGRVVWRQSLPVLRGVMLALPVVFVLGTLLYSADQIFADQINQFFRQFDLSRLPEYLFRLFYILVLAYMLTGLYLQAIYPQSLVAAGSRAPTPGAAQLPVAQADAGSGETAEAAVQPAPAEAKPVGRGMRFLGAIEAFIILGSVDLLFTFFVAIQFRYLFGGQQNISAAGYTYSEYARRGFFELVLVAVISLLLYLVLNAITWREKARQEKLFTGLSVLLVGLVCVILASALQRLLLYEAVYGFTRLRTYTHIFIPWLGFLLLATIIMQILRRERYFGALLLLTTFGFSLTLGIINIDGFIVRENVARVQTDTASDLDENNLLGLSDDALPALVKAYNASGAPPAIHDKLGGVLACRAYAWGHEAPQPWQSYHLGSALARQSLSGLDLSSYQVWNKQGQLTVMAGKISFPCVPRSFID